MYFILKLYWQTVLGIVALVLALLFVFLLFPQIVLGDGVRDIGADERKICRDPLHPIHNNKLLSRPRKEKRNTFFKCMTFKMPNLLPSFERLGCFRIFLNPPSLARFVLACLQLLVPDQKPD